MTNEMLGQKYAGADIQSFGNLLRGDFERRVAACFDLEEVSRLSFTTLAVFWVDFEEEVENLVKTMTNGFEWVLPQSELDDTFGATTEATYLGEPHGTTGRRQGKSAQPQVAPGTGIQPDLVQIDNGQKATAQKPGEVFMNLHQHGNIDKSGLASPLETAFIVPNTPISGNQHGEFMPPPINPEAIPDVTQSSSDKTHSAANSDGDLARRELGSKGFGASNFWVSPPQKGLKDFAALFEGNEVRDPDSIKGSIAQAAAPSTAAQATLATFENTSSAPYDNADYAALEEGGKDFMSLKDKWLRTQLQGSGEKHPHPPKSTSSFGQFPTINISNIRQQEEVEENPATPTNLNTGPDTDDLMDELTLRLNREYRRYYGG